MTRDTFLFGGESRQGLFMMVVVFAAMLLAFVFGWFGPRWMAITMLAACLILSVGLFLFEVYSPEYGFRMPWIQTELDGASQMVRES